MENRIQHVDGLRGVAILCVILYHAFSRWPAVVSLPYGSRFAPLFGWGWLGVELFFIISGFVIFLSLDKCTTFGEFITKRWLRLFPAMLIATLLIFATAPLVNRPDGLPTLGQAIPGLTFIDVRWLARLGGPDEMLEHSFWSLFAEMKFYFFSGAIYFVLGRTWSILGLLGAFSGYWICVAAHLQGPAWWAYLYDVPYWAWFGCGALFYEWKRTAEPKMFLAAIFVGIVASATPLPGVGSIPNMQWVPLAGLPFVLLFGASLSVPQIQRMLSTRWLLFLGFISYPLYLIHEEAVIGLTQSLGRYVADGWAAGLTTVLPIAVVMAAAWVIAGHLEGPFRGALRNFVARAIRAISNDIRAGAASK